MNTIYIETSAVLAWAFGEPSAKKIATILNEAKTITTSVLTLIEAERCFVRAETNKIIKSAERQKLKGLLTKAAATWTLMEITSEVQTRTKEPFPVEPIRSLDAIHLATALEFVKVFPEIQILTFDQRIVSNLEPLGLTSVSLSQ